MKTGGRIIGEGEDGCVLSEPMWPCTKGTHAILPDPRDPRYVSKIVDRSDDESDYIRAAIRILGPELSLTHIVQLKGECPPASNEHPPSSQDSNVFHNAKAAVLKWQNPEQACGKLKQELKGHSDITLSHTVMYLSKYPMSLSDWGAQIHSIKSSNDLLIAIPQFITVLQKLYQTSFEQLVNIDLHAGNIFVRPSHKGIKLGVADFGHCLYRQNVTGSGILFFGKYLCEYTAIYSLYSDYIQIPLEARLLNFCYKKKLEYTTPNEFIQTWLRDPDVIKHQKELPDSILIDHTNHMTTLLTKPLFIAMIESIQDISRKLHLNPSNPRGITLSLSANEKIVLEYIITRYGLISPINVISAVCNSNQKIRDIPFDTFITSAIDAPYIQTGSSLPSVLASIQGADLGILWADTVESTDS